ncbi:hypothetical protein BDW42DRAFT_189368 [Aspergillus taichungensis]|uniref:Uncharacterized protein n=1 Tax=Aspergillus taichungensis TaxID=482145 RepID=A0A2J5HEM4_9EURO|nr:hypothetical protein BDW42DRAFT_189368 [Aspergillus taichungensis]
MTLSCQASSSAVPDTLERNVLPGACLEPAAILKNAPAIPDGSLLGQEVRLKKIVVDNQLTALGFSNWAITGCRQCGLGGTLKNTECCPIILGIRKVTSFRAQTHKDCPRRKIITAIALAVAYIFSKRLVELQGQEDDVSLRPGHLYYTNKYATPCSGIFVGEVEDEACRWWQALLATGQGWKAEIAADSEGDKFTCLVRSVRNSPEQHSFSPPSSIRAMEFLRDFCVLHDAQSEIPIAMSIAFILPANNIYGLPVNLQWQIIDNPRFQSSKTNINKLQSFWDNIAHYLSICCHPRGMISNLCGAFWEPGIPCNMAHAWLYPPCKQLPDLPGISGSAHLYHEALLRVYVARRPNMGFLFLGACLTGIIPLVLHFVRSGLPVLDLDAAAWVGLPASPNFMLRSDSWRLLYITGEYPSPPLTPWGPFVRLHNKCGNHYLSYCLWGLHISNPPACSRAHTGDEQTRLPSEVLSIQNSASENATRLIFQWVTVNGDGFSPSERDVYNHEWVNAGDDFSESSTPDESEPEDDTCPESSSRQLTADWLVHL